MVFFLPESVSDDDLFVLRQLLLVLGIASPEEVGYDDKVPQPALGDLGTVSVLGGKVTLQVLDEKRTERNYVVVLQKNVC